MLTQTWLSPDFDNEEILPPPMGHIVFGRDRLSIKGGGIIIAVKDNLPYFLLKTDPILEILWVELRILEVHTYVRSQYSKFFYSCVLPSS